MCVVGLQIAVLGCGDSRAGIGADGGAVAPVCGEDSVPCCEGIFEGESARFATELSWAHLTAEGSGAITTVEAIGAADVPMGSLDATEARSTRAAGLRVPRSHLVLTTAGEAAELYSSVAADELAWLEGQMASLTERPEGLALHDDGGRLLLWQYEVASTVGGAPYGTVGDAPAGLPILVSVRTNIVEPTDLYCRHRFDCWPHDIHYLEVSVDGVVHALGPAESVDVDAGGLRYRVTHRVVASRTPDTPQCSNLGGETWSFDVVALGPSG